MDIMIHHENNEYEILLISNYKNNEYILFKKMPNGQKFECPSSGKFHNAEIMSESLRDAIGYGPAKDLLIRYGIPEDHNLFKLGRKG